MTTNLKVAEERIEQEIENDEGREDGIQATHEDETPL
jgi:hypothetical protein